MSKRTIISSLSGRVIDKVIIYHDDGNENPVALSIQCVGGAYFEFSANAYVAVKCVSTLADNRTGDLKNVRRRTFQAQGTVPYAPDLDD